MSTGNDLGHPKTLRRALAERDAWFDSAMQFSRNEDHYRKQRDAFLMAAMDDPQLAAVAHQIVGVGWQRLVFEQWMPGEPGSAK